MYPADSRFFKRSKATVERFLQTTVLIDDEAYFDKGPVSGAEDKSTSPGMNERASARPRGVTTTLNPPQDESGNGIHSLDAQTVINGFARKKIVCSVIRPTADIFSDSIIENLASSADIIIIDWKLDEHEDKGTKALNILEHITKAATDTPAQLRLFAIYTGEPALHDIVDKIKDALSEQFKADIRLEPGGLTLTYKSIRITVLAKPYTNLPRQQQQYQVPFEALPDYVTSEFAKMTAGLVSNVAVEALTCVRQNTFRILERFSNELDAPYFTHRSLQSEPEDAEAHLVALLSEEIRAILEEGKIGTETSVASISEWLDANDIQRIEPFSGKVLSKDRLVEGAESGISVLLEGLGKEQKKGLFKVLTKALLKSSSGSDHDEKFAVLTNMRSFYENSDRVLTLGTIIKLTTSSNGEQVPPSYYLCLQPVCDTVRLSEKRVFPFIPLDKANDKNPEFSIVIDEQSNGEMRFIHLSPQKKPHHLKLIEFAPQGHDRIVSSRSGDDFVFQDVEDNHYMWIGELRSEHAIRSLQNFANTMSRVGFNESEWLRLSAKKND